MTTFLSASDKSRAPTTFVALGLLIAIAPASWLEVISPVAWQHEIIHLTGAVGAGLAAVLPWATRQGRASVRRFYAWALLGSALLLVYVFSTSALALLTGFSVLFVGFLDMWMARAHVASNEYRDRINRQMRP